MNILITGGAGFIGSHLCDALIDEHNLTVIDNFVTGSNDNIKHLMDKDNFSLIEHDVSNQPIVKGPVDLIFHMASPASPIDYQKIPIKTMLVNSKGTYNMLHIASNNNAKILIASTSEIYGEPMEHPQHEDYWGNVNPIGPRACYDEAKRFSEAMTFSFKRKHDVDAKIVRIFNTFGPRMRKNDGRVIPNFINQCLNNTPITVYGDGMQTRSFCFVDDLVNGLIKVATSDKSGPFNLGNPSEITILDLAKEIRKLTDSGSEIVYKELPKNDPTRRKPDISKIKKMGWSPSVHLEEGLKRTIDYFKNKQ